LHDGVFESDVRLVYNVALGSAPATSARDRLNAWGLAQVGVEGSYSYWSRPGNAFPEIAPAFVSTEHAATLQILATATLGFEGLVF
jgi:hypothetical protein